VEPLETRRLLAIVVNTTLDESVANATTSLREALALAASTPADDVITFDPTVFDTTSFHTITPLAEPFSIAGTGGKVTIAGPGDNFLAISGAQAGRSFDVAAGAMRRSAA